MLTFIPGMWLAAYVLEALVLTTPLWVLSRYLAGPLLLAIIGTSVLLMSVLQPAFAVLVGVLALFRVINILRVMKGRMHRYYLFFTVRRTFLVLLGLHFLLGSGIIILTSLLDGRQLLAGLLLVQTTGAAVIFGTVVKNVRKLTFRMPGKFLSDSELPTVTVAIPARNETDDLQACLQSVLASDYPKLEIIVLDDCSQVQTADIIKSFAHGGVRFVQGDEPATRWLAKNQAYHKLYKEATGELILFIGVDVRLAPTSIRAMVNVLHAKRKSMISVLPKRETRTKDALVIQPMRYWWELALPRKIFNRPPVLSSCWMVDRSFLQSFGGFSSVSHSVLPEGVFAREAIKSNSYSFIRSSHELVVKTVKNYQEQRDTAIRVKYPQLRRRLENVLIITVAELTLFVLPLLFLLPLFWQTLGGLALLPVVSLALLVASHLIIIQITNPANLLLSLASFPVAVVMELILGYISAYRYEFGQVNWKDRNICIPVMHVVPKLPDLEP